MRDGATTVVRPVQPRDSAAFTAPGPAAAPAVAAAVSPPTPGVLSAAFTRLVGDPVHAGLEPVAGWRFTLTELTAGWRRCRRPRSALWWSVHGLLLLVLVFFMVSPEHGWWRAMKYWASVGGACSDNITDMAVGMLLVVQPGRWVRAVGGVILLVSTVDGLLFLSVVYELHKRRRGGC
eukprot:gene14171-52684_t